MRYKIDRVSLYVVRENADAPDPRLASGPTSVYALVTEMQMIPNDDREHFVVLMLDGQNRVREWQEISVGTMTASLVSPRDLFRRVLAVPKVASVVLVHNHPSGDPTPSREDIRLTRGLVEAGLLLDVPVHDHVIIGEGRFVSLAERGLI